MSTVLQCKNLCLGYENREVLHALSFSLGEGELLCVVGENGTGKSTLLRALLGLKKPSRGAILYGAGLRQTQIGYLPQQSAEQSDFPATAAEVVRSGCLNAMGARPFYRREEKARAAEAMTRLGVSGLAGRCFRELSGGQQRRVLLARALCATHKLLLLDEPAAGLDPVAAREFLLAAQALRGQQRIAMIMVTHDLPSVMEQADHILHLSSARSPGCQKNYFWGTPEDYRASGFGGQFLRGGKL
jgi:zinc transport system ATP-binding protein